MRIKENEVAGKLQSCGAFLTFAHDAALRKRKQDKRDGGRQYDKRGKEEKKKKLRGLARGRRIEVGTRGETGRDERLRGRFLFYNTFRV